MRQKSYEVVVVGCGPGGAIAGKCAALNGAETLVVEEKRQIGFPVYDSMSIIFSKSEMEETTGEKIELGAIYSRAEGLAYISPSGKEGKPQLLPDGIFVNRQLFEKSLAIAAVRAGAEIMLHTRVVDLVKEQGVVNGVIIRSGSELITIPCSLVIAADGSYQQMVRLAGIGFPEPSISAVSAAIGGEFGGVPDIEVANVGLAIPGEISGGPVGIAGELVGVPDVEVPDVGFGVEVGVAGVKVCVDRQGKPIVRVG